MPFLWIPRGALLGGIAMGLLSAHSPALASGILGDSSARRSAAARQACGRIVEDRPLVTIKSTDDVGLFFRVTGGVFTDSGIVISSSGTQSVLLFDGRGKLERTLGRKGDGPGEFRYLSGLWRLNDSTLLVSDNAKHQATLFDQRLRNVRTVRLELTSGVRWPSVVGGMGDKIVAINGQAFENGQMGRGSVRPPYQVLRFELSGRLRDTLIVLEGREFWVPELSRGGPTRAMPWGRDAVYATGAGAFFSLATDGGQVQRTVQRNQPTVFATVPSTLRKIEADDIARYKSEQRAAAVTPAQRRAVELQEGVPFPDYFPTADLLVVGKDGSLWLRRVARRVEAMNDWDMLSGDGRTRCTVKVPASIRVLDASGDRLLGVVTDANDEETIVVYRTSRG